MATCAIWEGRDQYLGAAAVIIISWWASSESLVLIIENSLTSTGGYRCCPQSSWYQATEIMPTCQYGCTMCAMVGGWRLEISIWWNIVSVSCHQEPPSSSSTDTGYIRPIREHYFILLWNLHGWTQKSRIGNLSAFLDLVGWLASDIYWKVEWAKNKIGRKLAQGSQAGTLAEGPRQQEAKWRAPGRMPRKNRSDAQGWGCANKQVKQLILKINITWICFELV